jgi:phosphate-selective porin
MKHMNKTIRLIWMGVLVLALAGVTAQAQRPRTTDPSGTNTATTTPPPTQPAPQTVKVKYEGGFFGYNKKMDGTINFDDSNRRLVFRNKEQQEVFSIPYDSVASAFADVKSKRPVAADVAGRLSILTMPALLIKKKFRYLTLQYNDPDTSMNGVTSFKMENEGILNSALYSLAQKASLTQRGNVYVRRKDNASTNQQP